MRKDLVIDKPVRDYLVTEIGQVVVNHGKNKGRILSVYESNNGYAKCTLRKNRWDKLPCSNAQADGRNVHP